MCSPAIALTAASTIFGAVSSMQQGNAQAAAYKAQAESDARTAEYNAKVDEQNAQIQKDAAKDAIQRGTADAAIVRENARRANATARAIGSATGFSQGTGTALDILSQNTATGELDALTVKNNAAREAYGYEIKAMDAQASADGSYYQAANSRILGDYKAKTTQMEARNKALGTVISGFSQGYSQYKAKA